jgi:hypothetical protein
MYVNEISGWEQNNDVNFQNWQGNKFMLIEQWVGNKGTLQTAKISKRTNICEWNNQLGTKKMMQTFQNS